MIRPLQNSIYCVLSFMVWLTNLGYAQEMPTDTSFLASSRKKAIAFYTRSIQDQSRLYNGSDYVVYMPEKEEHPYFKVDDWSNGSIIYWNELYENVPLMYDINTDQIITEHNKGNAIKLVAEKVQGFTLLGQTFVRLTKDDKNNIAEGFYAQLYNGKAKVYSKYSKQYNETLETQQVIPRFDQHVRHYIMKDGVLNVVRSKGSALAVFADRKQEVKSFIRKNKIRFKNNRDSALVSITTFYDTLND